jgi:hypothetical protein
VTQFGDRPVNVGHVGANELHLATNLRLVDNHRVKLRSVLGMLTAVASPCGSRHTDERRHGNTEKREGCGDDLCDAWTNVAGVHVKPPDATTTQPHAACSPTSTDTASQWSTTR